MNRRLFLLYGLSDSNMETFIVGILFFSLDDKHNKQIRLQSWKSIERKNKSKFFYCFLSSFLFLEIIAKDSHEGLKREKRKTHKKIIFVYRIYFNCLKSNDLSNFFLWSHLKFFSWNFFLNETAGVQRLEEIIEIFAKLYYVCIFIKLLHFFLWK